MAIVKAGLLGEVTQAQVSAAHGYHGISLIRRYLGIKYEPVKITARRFGQDRGCRSSAVGRMVTSKDKLKNRPNPGYRDGRQIRHEKHQREAALRDISAGGL